MESQITLDLRVYESIRQEATDAKRQVKELQETLEKMKEGGKVLIIETFKKSMWQCLDRMSSIESKKYVAKDFDEVKDEVTKHFKEGLFNEELKKKSKALEASYESELKRLHEVIENKCRLIDEYDAQIDRVYARNLIERIFNKYV